MPTVMINGVPLNYREHGARNKPALVLLHTVLWGAEVFTPLIATLEEDYYILDLDLHGHGGSGYRTPLTLNAMTADYVQLLTHLGLSQVTWIGYSIGSMIGLRLALHYPALLDKLVLIASNVRPDTSPVSVQTQQLWDLFRAGHRADIVEAALPFFFAQATLAQQPHLVEQYRRQLLAFQAVEGIYQAAMAANEGDDIMAQLGAISAKTLIIAGREDLTATPAEAEEMAAHMTNAHLGIIEEASHLLLVEKPQEVISLIRNFLKER